MWMAIEIACRDLRLRRGPHTLCSQNPGYMLASCKKSCQSVYNAAAAADAMKVVDSFDQLSATDIDGRTVHFGTEFQDRVVLITNVASE